MKNLVSIQAETLRAIIDYSFATELDNLETSIEDGDSIDGHIAIHLMRGVECLDGYVEISLYDAEVDYQSTTDNVVKALKLNSLMNSGDDVNVSEVEGIVHCEFTGVITDIRTTDDMKELIITVTDSDNCSFDIGINDITI